MDVAEIIMMIDGEIARLTALREVMNAYQRSSEPSGPVVVADAPKPSGRNKGYKMSAAARQRISVARKAYFARKKNAA